MNIHIMKDILLYEHEINKIDVIISNYKNTYEIIKQIEMGDNIYKLNELNKIMDEIISFIEKKDKLVDELYKKKLILLS